MEKESESNDVYHDLNTDTPAASPDNTPKIVGAIVLAGALIAGAILLRGLPGPTSGGSSEKSAGIEFREVSAADHVLGNIAAAVMIIEYSDTECPFCKAFHATLHQVIMEEENVAWVYRHFPIASLHRKAAHEAEATECAAEQGKFWEYIDELFRRTPSNDGLAEAELPRIAGDVGMDVNVFNTCLMSGKFKEKIEADMADGAGAGARGTPYTLLVSENKITAAKQKEILALVGRPEYVTFYPEKNAVSLNGALPYEMVSGIVSILLK